MSDKGPIEDATTYVVEADDSKPSSMGANIDAGIADYIIDPAEERRVIRLIDAFILPIVTVMYFFNSLDRSNLSNAKTDGILTDIKGSPAAGYTIVISVFTVFFSFVGPVAMIATRRWGAHLSLPTFMLGFGICAMCNAAIKNFAELLVVRILLGIFEAGFASSLIFYITTFYTREELGRRIGVFYSCLAFAGAFGGLISYGVFSIKNDKLYGWQYLFLIEGGCTVLFALIAFFLLPKSPSTARFLTERQREIAVLRILRDSSAQAETSLSWKAYLKPTTELKFWVFAVIAICYGTASSLASNFLSIIIQRFGFSTVKTNLYTVAPNFFSAVCLLVCAFWSDKIRQRGWFLLSALVMTFTGCVILAAVPVTKIGVGYFACFLIAGGAFTPSVLYHAWHQNNDVSEDGRAWRISALTCFANLGGIVSANIFKSSYAPYYTVPLGITAGLEALAIILVLSVRTYWARENAKRNAAQNVKWTSADVPTEALVAGPSDPRFRYFL